MSRKFGMISRYRTLADLPAPNAATQALPKDRRGRFEICVVDDQSFDAGRNLRNYGYRFSEIGDLKNIEEVAGFPIVLCDLMGVGLNFDDRKQGATLIREIKHNYPSIMVAAYSGASASSEQAKTAIALADKFIKKDADYETWTQTLDSLISDASDQRKIWMRVRKSLVDDGIDTKVLLMLEDAYVTSILSGKSGFTMLTDVASKRGLSKFALDVVNGLVSSVIFRAMTGS
jgi:DNA-binding NarL/FixJ family response regulator